MLIYKHTHMHTRRLYVNLYCPFQGCPEIYSRAIETALEHVSNRPQEGVISKHISGSGKHQGKALEYWRSHSLNGVSGYREAGVLTGA